MRFTIPLTMKTVVLGCLCIGVLTVGACAGGPEVPTAPSTSAAVSGLAATASVTPSFPRSGELHLTKECSPSNGGPFCTITSSNLKAIEVGSRVVYLHPADVPTPAGSDVILDLPGPGDNSAFGHCSLALGVCTFSGGTGKFTNFHATADVSYIGGFDFALDGTYTFDPRD
jgi:hypothetical protein